MTPETAAALRAKIEHELDEMMMGAENYFGAINPKRAGHIHCALDRIMAWVAMRELLPEASLTTGDRRK